MRPRPSPISWSVRVVCRWPGPASECRPTLLRGAHDLNPVLPEPGAPSCRIIWRSAGPFARARTPAPAGAARAATNNFGPQRAPDFNRCGVGSSSQACRRGPEDDSRVVWTRFYCMSRAAMVAPNSYAVLVAASSTSPRTSCALTDCVQPRPLVIDRIERTAPVVS